ncbi:TIGR02921 family PEP-CTERM protein [Microcoleus sp. FACHB-672]|uniref:TIGR02921 family PEP-CTERM protein n=1 Tax=Microcoleus sp. FACHB-672 TaxID=2692825 RepID=UPI0016877F43|nr:TIGR02921 family PEP-CTERM protein [Microcoleus sp. FACHB-672]MBD2042606.1 TIGR02921 family PEP-CTERM protein [Microcoleus sp. FACHB-672]
MKDRLNALFQVIFWLWNLTFLLLTYLGILPLIGPALIEATFTGLIPSEFLITLIALIAVPTACTAMGGWRFHNQPLQLMRLFYGVEAPLFALCLLRFFILRELTPASTLILGTLVVCVAAFLLELLYGYAERHPALAWAQLIAHSLMLIVGLYAGLLLLFYAVPAAPFVVFGVFGFLGELWRILTSEPLLFLNYAFTAFLLVLLFGITCTLFLAMPSLLASSYIQSGYRILLTFAGQNGRTRAFAGSLGVVTAWMILFISFQQQPQIQAFELLDKPAATDNTRAELVAKSDTIRTGLLNAYLSSYRYLSTIQESNQIRVMYEKTFNTPQPVSQFLQDSYNRLMSPFLYNGSRQDIKKAEKLYADFFDKPIQKGEQEAVLHALKSTVNRDEAKAGLLNIGQKKVWLQTQEVTVKPHGDWADVELYEVYKNQTTDVEEVLYYFSLPESAVLTGVWLGDTNDRAKRFPFTVSPRGAAQKVYNQQVNRARPVDPALLEQVGPRHYRLRAFPVPAPLTTWERNNSTQRPTEMNLWLTYQVIREEKGWPLPVLGEKRNIFWTKNTQRIRNGQTVKDFQDSWLEAYLPADGQDKPASHQVNLPDGSRITAKPLAEKDYTLPQGKRFAVVVDTSRSMAAHTQQLSETFKWLKDRGFADNNAANNDADLYITASTGKQPQRIDDLQKFDVGKMPLYGTLQLKEMLRQFVQLRGDIAYDGILVVTDEGSYELSDDSKEVPVMPAPAWMVHLGAMPPAYDDATLKAIQDSGGGVATNLPEVLERMATKAALGPSAVSVVDGYAWVREKPVSETPKPQPGNKAKATPENKAQTASNTGFEPLAARQLVLGLSKTIKGNEISQLDAIHAIAKNFKIVTPYSSMIVLVNDEQRKALKEAEADLNRFDRQVEDGNEQLETPNNPLNASVPEPGTVIGLAAGTVMLIVARQRRRFKSRI